jgi:hypothetical protein
MEDTKKREPSAGYMALLLSEALRAGGIKIHQFKEKFGGIRIYVGVPGNHEARSHYREMYLAAMAASPALADNLHSNADKAEWLYATEKDLDEAIKRRVARGGENALEAWAPHWALARKLIRGENTDDFLDGDTEIEEVAPPVTEVTLDLETLNAAQAAVAWACAQSGGGGWVEVYQRLTDAMNNKGKKQ